MFVLALARAAANSSKFKWWWWLWEASLGLRLRPRPPRKWCGLWDTPCALRCPSSGYSDASRVQADWRGSRRIGRSFAGIYPRRRRQTEEIQLRPRRGSRPAVTSTPASCTAPVGSTSVRLSAKKIKKTIKFYYNFFGKILHLKFMCLMSFFIQKTLGEFKGNLHFQSWLILKVTCFLRNSVFFLIVSNFFIRK